MCKVLSFFHNCRRRSSEQCVAVIFPQLIGNKVMKGDKIKVLETSKNLIERERIVTFLKISQEKHKLKSDPLV